MQSETVDRKKLAAYLLGMLPEAEQEAIAAQYFMDDELFAQLQSVEDDLIDQYAQGQLSARERRRLESYLDSLPDGWQRVATARALIKVLDEGEIVAAPETEEPGVGLSLAESVVESTVVAKSGTWQPAAVLPTPEPAGLRQRLIAWLAQPIPALVMVTGLTVLGGALIWLILRYQQLSHDQERWLARDEQQTQSLRETERKLAEAQTSNTQLREEIEREKQRRETQPPVQSPAISLPMIPWPLSSTVVRDPNQPSGTVRLDPKAKTVALTIPVRGKQKYTGYEVELKTEDGRQILWKDNQPSTPPSRSGQNIVFYRPASEFDAASYKLTLTLISAQETKTRDYYFSAVRK